MTPLLLTDVSGRVGEALYHLLSAIGAVLAPDRCSLDLAGSPGARLLSLDCSRT